MGREFPSIIDMQDTSDWYNMRPLYQRLNEASDQQKQQERIQRMSSLSNSISGYRRQLEIAQSSNLQGAVTLYQGLINAAQTDLEKIKKEKEKIEKDIQIATVKLDILHARIRARHNRNQQFPPDLQLGMSRIQSKTLDQLEVELHELEYRGQTMQNDPRRPRQQSQAQRTTTNPSRGTPQPNSAPGTSSSSRTTTQNQTGNASSRPGSYPGSISNDRPKTMSGGRDGQNRSSSETRREEDGSPQFSTPEERRRFFEQNGISPVLSDFYTKYKSARRFTPSGVRIFNQDQEILELPASLNLRDLTEKYKIFEGTEEGFKTAEQIYQALLELKKQASNLGYIF